MWFLILNPVAICRKRKANDLRKHKRGIKRDKHKKKTLKKSSVTKIRTVSQLEQVGHAMLHLSIKYERYRKTHPFKLMCRL